MPFLTVNNAQFYYELHGQGQPLVLISGLKGDHTSWLSVLNDFANYYQVLIFDNRAVGQTVDQEESLSVEQMADDTWQIIQALGLSNPHIVGHSLGGAIAQMIASNHPTEIASMVLANTFTKFNQKGREAFSATLALHEANASPVEIMEQISPYVFSKSFLTPKVQQLIRDAVSNQAHPQSTLNYKRQLDALYAFDSSPWIQTINVPTLVLSAVEDQVATIEDGKLIAKSIPHAQFVNTETSHASSVEKPQEFFHLLHDFFQKK